jgi:hypothetical protein
MANAVPDCYVLVKQENSDQMQAVDLFVFATEIVCL